MTMLCLSLSQTRHRSLATLQSAQAACNWSHLVHEACVRPYDTIHYPELTKDWFNSGFSTYDELTATVTKWISSGQSTFIKDMAFAAEPWLDDALGITPSVVVLLWIRDPYAQLVSAYRTFGLVDGFDVVCDLGTVARIFDRLMSSGHRVIVCDSDDLASNPAPYLGVLGNILRLKRPLGATHWTTTTAEEMKSRWYESKTIELVNKMHADGMNSTHFTPPVPLVPDFSHFDPAHREPLRALYESNLKWYETLKKYSIKIF